MADLYPGNAGRTDIGSNMSLGTETLTDDQLLELLQEACLALASRDGYVRALAQKTIVTEGQRLQIAKASLEGAVDKLRLDYVTQIQQEAEEHVRAMAAAGTLQLVAPQEEAAMIIEAHRVAKLKIMEELMRPSSAEVTLTISGDQVNIRSGNVDYDTRRAGLSRELREQIVRLVGII